MLSGRDGFAKARNGRNEVTLSIGPPLRIYFRTHSFELLASVNSTSRSACPLPFRTGIGVHREARAALIERQGDLALCEQSKSLHD
jgi:hypothetical protein